MAKKKKKASSKPPYFIVALVASLLIALFIWSPWASPEQLERPSWIICPSSGDESNVCFYGSFNNTQAQIDAAESWTEANGFVMAIEAVPSD